MIDAVWKLIMFVSMLYRITKSSRNERVTLRVYNTYSTSVRYMHPWSHGTHPGGSLIRKLQHTKRFLLRSRHFLFVTPRIERRGEGLRMRSKLEYLLFRSMWETCFCMHFQSSYGRLNRSSHFGTWCTWTRGLADVTP
jgi:hypothetical protein